MTTSYAGPTAAMYLADLGAEVVKIERPGGGDDTRSWGPPFVDEDAAWFASANRNKRSVVLDLRSEVGRDALLALLERADVFVQNMNPSKLEAMGIDAATLRARNPRLIYCAMSGFGLDGPDSDLPGYDLVAQARSGIMSVTGERGGRPQRVSTALSDVVTGMCAVMAINAALVRQKATGDGDVIDVSLLDTDLALMAPRIAAYHAGEPEPRPSGGTDSVLAVYQPFEAADREIVVAIGNDGMWLRFCAALGLDDLAEEPALRDNAGRREHRTRIADRVSRCLSTRRAAEWVGVLAGAGIPASLVQSLSEVVRDPHVIARGALLDVPGTDGRMVSVHTPFRLASIGEPRNERFPDLGEHTREVLSEIGFTESRVSEALVAVGLATHTEEPA
jgi:crotonobetainyl-CoA:carnitine CoA-transferase CaiB-like acyl-CoA transferase